MEEKQAEQNVFLYSRSRLELTGIVDVCEFTGRSVEMTLKEGFLGVDGEGLKIDYFNSESGKVSIHGCVTALTYYSKAQISKKQKKKKKSSY